MHADELCAVFEVKKAVDRTRQIKSAIRSRCTNWIQTGVCLALWMKIQSPGCFKVNGLTVDARSMPSEIQEIAYQKGLIPYIPADRECKE
jgi:hypothetical protein